MGRRRTQAEGGFTLVEATVAVTIFAVVLFSIIGMTARDNRLSQATVSIGVAEMRAQQMLDAVERELLGARGASPRAVLTQNLAAGEQGSIGVNSTLGFPDRGILLVDRGAGNVERIAYGALTASLTQFTNLTRAAQCTTATGHVAGGDVLWAGLAEVVQLQPNPPAALFDGRARESTGVAFFRGDGTGFSYRVPTDPTGGTDYLDGDAVRWGARVEGLPTLTGWAALTFEPRAAFDENDAGHDLNGDGDTADVFDVGQIQKRTWDTADPSRPARELGLGPTFLLQERCNWGGDLDGDGFDDPLFLFDPSTRTLHVRLFVLGESAGNRPIVRAVESTIFLRNDPEN